MRVCIIPARGGSSRIPRKNIRSFHGRPIIEYSIETAKKVCDRVIVSTEDFEIAEVARKMGAEVHQRSFEMAEDGVGTQSVARDVLNHFKVKRTDRVVVLYPCAPMVESTDLILAFDLSKKGFVVAVGSDPLRDAGAFYVGRCGAFRDGIPLYEDSTRIFVLPEERVCDINTEEDWTRCEQMYAAIHHVHRAEAQGDLENSAELSSLREYAEQAVAAGLG